MSKLQGSVAPCSRKAAMCIVRTWRALTTTPKPHRAADRACIPHRDPGAEAGVVRGIRPRNWRERQALSSLTREPQDALDPGRLPRSTGDPTKPSARAGAPNRSPGRFAARSGVDGEAWRTERENVRCVSAILRARRPLPSQKVCVETGAMLRVGARHGRGSRRLLSRSHHIPERQEPHSD